jgi:hypothetical protein
MPLNYLDGQNKFQKSIDEFYSGRESPPDGHASSHPIIIGRAGRDAEHRGSFVEDHTDEIP